MAKSKNPKKNRPQKSEAAAPAVAQQGGGMHAARETIESIVIAFVLAFLFRTFEAEAFVIPTGSMSPSLQGQHKDVDCSECGYRFRTTASEENSDRRLAEIANHRYLAKQLGVLRSQYAAVSSPFQKENLGRKLASLEQEVAGREQRIAGYETVTGMCPMCRQTMAMRPDLPGGVPDFVNTAENGTETSYPGDRILVNKYSYTHSDPERWDVVVFKFPGNGEMNYIKRLVGLPNETLRVYQGDIFIRNDLEDQGFAIERKPADKVEAMLQTVHDTDFDSATLYEAGWPLRWEASSPTGWEVDTKPGAQTVEQTFRFAANEGGELAWLRYHHRVPQDEDWSVAREFQQSGKYPGIDKSQWLEEVRPQLVRDFNPYNARRLREHIRREGWSIPENLKGMHWVGDLAIDCEVNVDQAQGELALDLVEAGQHFVCRFDLATGQATVGVKGNEELSVTVDTPLSSAGTYQLRFANVDDQLLLWVDGDLISLTDENPAFLYDADQVFGSREEAIPQTSDTDLGDLAPVGIGARGTKLTVNRLEVLRDIYYLATSWLEQNKFSDYPNPRSSIFVGDNERLPALESIRELFTNPDAWPRFSQRRKVDFPIKEEQLFVMGDNSPESLDCRLWASPNGRTGSKPGGAYLDRRLMIGKAVCVFWPHSWGGIPGASKLPGFPNFGDMRIVR